MAKTNEKAQPYALKPGEGWTYHSDTEYTIKLREDQQGRASAVMEYTARKGEEPEPHTHPTEDEMFYVLDGSLTFHCDGEDFDVKKGGFIFLPRGKQHGYTVRSQQARLLTITSPLRRSPKDGWGGIIGEIGSDKKSLIAKPGN